MKNKKEELRVLYKEKRWAYVKTENAKDLQWRFLETFKKHIIPLLQKSSVISLYNCMDSEANPVSIKDFLQREGYKLALPQMRETDIAFVSIHKKTVFHTSCFGFEEPLEKTEPIFPDVILIPLLAFDQHGNRLGYGKGHYDRNLQKIKSIKNPFVLGMAYPCQQAEILPFEPHDQKLDAILLPDAYITFKKTNKK